MIVDAKPHRLGRPPSPLAAVVFDLDGTLYNQTLMRLIMAGHLGWAVLRKPARGLAAVRFLQAYRQSLELLRRSDDQSGLELRQLQMASDKSGLTGPQAQQVLDEFFERKPLGQLRRCARAGLARFLQEARDKKVRLGVLSDYPAQRKLEAMGISAYFDATVSSYSMSRLKPSPEGLLHCLKLLAVPASQTVYVGDRVDVDAECARRAGVFPVVFGADGRGQDLTRVHSFRSLGALLLRP